MPTSKYERVFYESGKIYYIREEVYDNCCLGRARKELDFLRMADFAVDARTGELVKCRVDLYELIEGYLNSGEREQAYKDSKLVSDNAVSDLATIRKLTEVIAGTQNRSVKFTCIEAIRVIANQWEKV